MRTNYTLYIDESGDFESPRGHWVIAGLLLPDSYRNCEHQLNSLFANAPALVGVGLQKDIHLTELRSKFGSDEALVKARRFLATLNKLGSDYQFVSCVNFSKARGRSREKAYRLMLADLLALLETTLAEQSAIGNLDVVVATRTINGVRQTSLSDIRDDVLASLPVAMETDLATKGLVELIGSHIDVRMEYANNSWGLICADFVSNINYHRDRWRERALLDEFEASGKFVCFESSGGFAARRARVAERNGDFAAAIHQWIAMIDRKGPLDEADGAVQRLLGKIVNYSGANGTDSVFEALLERIWRQGGRERKLGLILSEFRILDAAFVLFRSHHTQHHVDHLQFRLRNLTLITCNHLGRSDFASEVVALQAKVAPVLAANPEHFGRVMEFKVAASESHVNALEIESALTAATDYSAIVENYYATWCLLLEDDDADQFHRSRFFIKSEMSFIRLSLINYDLSRSLDDAEISARLDRLDGLIVDSGDKSRLRNCRILFLLKQRMWSDAVDVHLKRFFDSGLHAMNQFDTFWFLRAVNDAWLNGVSPVDLRVDGVVNEVIRHAQIDGFGHPRDLIAREAGLFWHLSGQASIAKRMLRRSKNAAPEAEAPIMRFLEGLRKVHEDLVYGRERDVRDLFAGLAGSEWVSNVLRSRLDMPLINKLRHYSPY